jgi:hypothetical protein
LKSEIRAAPSGGSQISDFKFQILTPSAVDARRVESSG